MLKSVLTEFSISGESGGLEFNLLRRKPSNSKDGFSDGRPVCKRERHSREPHNGGAVRGGAEDGAQHHVPGRDADDGSAGHYHQLDQHPSAHAQEHAHKHVPVPRRARRV